MENIKQWNNDVAFFHRDFCDDCKLLAKQIDESLKSLLNSFNQESKLELISSNLNELCQDNQIYSQLKSKLKLRWEKIKSENDFPTNIINDIFKDENVISPNELNLTEQEIEKTKSKIIQACLPLQSDINSLEKIFYNEIYTIASDLNNIQKNKPNYSKEKNQIFNNILKYFIPSISVFNLYASINIQQKFHKTFKDEIDKISLAEAQENVSQPIIKPPNMENPSFIQSMEHPLFTRQSPFNDNEFSINPFPQNEYGRQNNLRNSLNSSFFKNKRSGAQNPVSQPFNPGIDNNFVDYKTENENLKKEIINLKKIIGQLQSENKSLKEQNHSLEEELSSNEMIINDLAEGNEEMQDEINILKSNENYSNELDILKEKNNELQSENDNLRALLESFETQ